MTMRIPSNNHSSSSDGMKKMRKERGGEEDLIDRKRGVHLRHQR